MDNLQNSGQQANASNGPSDLQIQEATFLFYMQTYYNKNRYFWNFFFLLKCQENVGRGQ